MHAIIQDCSIVIRNDLFLQGEPDTGLQEVMQVKFFLEGTCIDLNCY